MWQAVCSDCCACLRFLPEVFAVKGKKNYRYQSDKVTVDHWYCVIIFTIRHLIPVPSSSHNIIKDYSACGALFVIVAEKHTKMMQVDLSEPRSNVSPPPSLTHFFFIPAFLIFYFTWQAQHLSMHWGQLHSRQASERPYSGSLCCELYIPQVPAGLQGTAHCRSVYSYLLFKSHQRICSLPEKFRAEGRFPAMKPQLAG